MAAAQPFTLAQNRREHQDEGDDDDSYEHPGHALDIGSPAWRLD